MGTDLGLARGTSDATSDAASEWVQTTSDGVCSHTPYNPLASEHPDAGSEGPGWASRPPIASFLSSQRLHAPAERIETNDAVCGADLVMQPAQPVLRPYQAEGIDAATAYVAEGGMAALLVWPTGAGKSVALGEISRRTIEAGRRVLIATHVGELVEQDAAACARAVGEDAVGVYSAGLDRREADKPVTVASVQSIYRSPARLGRQHLVIVDEAHLVSHNDAGMYRQLLTALRQWGPTPLLGLTATPYRLSSGRLIEAWRDAPALFDKIVHEVSIRSLIADGYLARPIAKATRAKLDTEGVATRHGEYVASELQAAVNVEAINKAIAGEIVERGRDRRSWLVFASGIEHAHALAAELWAHDIAAAAIDGTTPKAERKAAVEAFKAGELRALVGCNIFTTGFDAPAVDLLAICRPTMSPGLHVQMLGRGTRLAAGKADCLVLDFAGNTFRHGPLDLIDGSQVAKVGKGKGEAPVKPCPECETLVPAAVRTCPECDHAFPVAARELKLVTSPLAGRVLSDDPAAWLPVSAVRYARHHKDGRPDTLRIEYEIAGRPWPVREWLAFDGSDAARRIARERWRKRSASHRLPWSVNDALNMTADLRRPVAILTRPDPSNPRYEQIVEIQLARSEAAA